MITKQTPHKLVHYTHSRKDMIGFIKIYDIGLTNYTELGRVELGELIYDKLNSGGRTSDIADLIYYLTMSMPRKAPICSIKKDIFDRLMKLKTYHKNNYKIKKSKYCNIKEIDEDMVYISEYGDLPSVRYIVNKINQDNKIKKKYEVKFSRQPRCYVKDVNKLNIMRGDFLIKFD